MPELTGKSALITGADSTARIIAETLARNGVEVFACDIREEAVNALLSSNPAMRATVADIGVEADAIRVTEEAVARFGKIDILVNVVGVAGPTKPIEEITSTEWRDTMNTNINGVFYTARAMVPGMKARQSGVILNFSTASTRTRLPNRLPYITSKYAVEGLTLNLARELGPFGIRVNGILPGPINNDRLQLVLSQIARRNGSTIEKVALDALQYVSMRCLIEPQELADTVTFLCSDRARHITGQLIGVDGNQEWEG
jgi:NAD(P)-dependent dehydrogenase (short-subunit alcohol dehydrogenase family)